MSVIYKPASDSPEALRKEFSLADVQKAVGDDKQPKLQWWPDAPEPGYDLYVVRINALTDTTVGIRFIDCTTGKEIGDWHTIDRKDRTLVFDGPPSTLDGYDPASQNDCAFLFFAHNVTPKDPKLAADLKAATTSGGGQGKWPAGAPLGTLNVKLKATIEELRGVLKKLWTQSPAAFDSLKPNDRATLENLLEGNYL